MRTLPVSGTAAPIRPLRPRALSPVQLAVVAVAAVDPPAPFTCLSHGKWAAEERRAYCDLAGDDSNDYCCIKFMLPLRDARLTTVRQRRQRRSRSTAQAIAGYARKKFLRCQRAAAAAAPAPAPAAAAAAAAAPAPVPVQCGF
jgi:hypothetical protein